MEGDLIGMRERLTCMEYPVDIDVERHCGVMKKKKCFVWISLVYRDFELKINGTKEGERERWNTVDTVLRASGMLHAGERDGQMIKCIEIDISSLKKKRLRRSCRAPGEGIVHGEC